MVTISLYFVTISPFSESISGGPFRDFIVQSFDFQSVFGVKVAICMEFSGVFCEKIFKKTLNSFDTPTPNMLQSGYSLKECYKPVTTSDHF